MLNRLFILAWVCSATQVSSLVTKINTGFGTQVRVNVHSKTIQKTVKSICLLNFSCIL